MQSPGFVADARKDEYKKELWRWRVHSEFGRSIHHLRGEEPISAVGADGEHTETSCQYFTALTYIEKEGRPLLQANVSQLGYIRLASC